MKNFLERNLSHFTRILQDNIFMEEAALQKGWLQKMDPRAKALSIFSLLIVSTFSRSLGVIAILYGTSLALAAGSRIFSLSFLRKVWIFMPFYTMLIAIPALFLTPGTPFASLDPLPITITRQGIEAALFLILRVAVSVSMMLLLVLTTSWPVLLKAFRSLGLPRILVLMLSMTYRYIYVLLHTANNMFLARKSRKVGPENWESSGRWMGRLMGALLGKSQHLSHEVFLAMQARGFRGEPVLLIDFEMKTSDYGWMSLLMSIAGIAFYFGYWRYL